MASSRSRRGTAAVEFAIVLPLLMTLVLGCVDFGRFAYTYITVTNAAREGANFAALHPVPTTTAKWQQAVANAAINEMGSAFIAAKISVSAPVITVEANGLKHVRVDVSYPFQTIVNWPLLPHNLTLRGAAVMRVLH